MTYKLTWLVPNRLIEMIFSEDTGDETILMFDYDINAMLDTASQPVHILMDARSIKIFPSVQTSMKMKYYKHPHMGSLVIVGLTANPFLRFLGSVVGRTVGIAIKNFTTPEEARAYLMAIEKV